MVRVLKALYAVLYAFPASESALIRSSIFIAPTGLDDTARDVQRDASFLAL